MKTIKWILIAIVAIPFLTSCGYNKMVGMEEASLLIGY